MEAKTEAFLEELDPVINTLSAYCRNHAICAYCPFYSRFQETPSCLLRINGITPDSHWYTAAILYKDVKPYA